MADNYDDVYWSRFLAAQDAGLNREACIMVANQEITLADALGDMDMNAESLPMCDELADEEENTCGCSGFEGCSECVPFL